MVPSVLRQWVLGFTALSIGVERAFDFELSLAVLGDGQESLTVVERLERIEDRVLLNFAAFDSALSPSSLSLSLD